MKDIKNSSTAVTELNNLRNKLNSSIKNTSINNNSTASSMPIDKNKIILGAKVYVTTFDQNGIVISNINKSDEVQVQIGLIKTNVNIKFLEEPHNLKDDLTKPIPSSHSTVSKTRSANSEINVIGLSVDEAIPIVDKFLEEPRNLKNDLTKPTPSSHSTVSKTRLANSEINVIGLTVDEALPIIDKFLDDCFLAKLSTARIVHGKGTGKLRQGIHSFLKKHKRVSSFRIGTYGEGEMGVTIVEIK